MTTESAARLRSIPTLTGTAPPIDLDIWPQRPDEAFHLWLEEALNAGVIEPIAATLATVDSGGMPDARTLLLKDVDEEGWAFSSTGSSRKATQLAACPAAALELYWPAVARAVRVRGPVVAASEKESEADLAGRSAAARALVAPGDWRLWRVVPERVEFWQGSRDRQHLRIIHTRDDRGSWRWKVERAEG